MVTVMDDNLRFFQEKLTNRFIGKIRFITPHDILMSVSGLKSEFLLVSLFNAAPSMAFVHIDFSPENTYTDRKYAGLAEKIEQSKIIGFEVLDNERICKFILRKSSVFQEVRTYQLYTELITNKSNLVLTDDSDTVLWVYREKDLTVGGSLVNSVYRAADQHKKGDGLRYFPRLRAVLAPEEQNGLYARYFHYKYRDLVTAVKNKHKSLKRKLAILETELAESQKNLVYAKLGNYLLTNQNDFLEAKHVIFENTDYVFDENKTLFENIQSYFKMYRKAKSAVLYKIKEIDKCMTDLAFADDNLAKLDTVSEFYWDHLSEELAKKGWYKAPREKEKHKGSDVPYYAETGSARIYFGRNRYQNDFLTFRMAHHGDYVFHVSGYPGAHVLVNEKDMSNDNILAAAYIALSLSGLTAGEVVYGQRKFIKKGDEIGQIVYIKHETVLVKNIPDGFSDILKNSKRQ